MRRGIFGYFFLSFFAGIGLAVIWDDVAGEKVSGVRLWSPVGPVYLDGFGMVRSFKVQRLCSSVLFWVLCLHIDATLI